VTVVLLMEFLALMDVIQMAQHVVNRVVAREVAIIMVTVVIRIVTREVAMMRVSVVKLVALVSVILMAAVFLKALRAPIVVPMMEELALLKR